MGCDRGEREEVRSSKFKKGTLGGPGSGVRCVRLGVAKTEPPGNITSFMFRGHEAGGGSLNR